MVEMWNTSTPILLNTNSYHLSNDWALERKSKHSVLHKHIIQTWHSAASARNCRVSGSEYAHSAYQGPCPSQSWARVPGKSPGSKECPGRATSPHELHGATNQIPIPGKYLCNLLLSKRFGPKILKLNFQPMTGKVKLRFSPKNRLPCLVNFIFWTIQSSLFYFCWANNISFFQDQIS